jgi:hypothetical protein
MRFGVEQVLHFERHCFDQESKARRVRHSATPVANAAA